MSKFIAALDYDCSSTVLMSALLYTVYGGKMPQSAPFVVLVAALLLSTLSCCSAENVYCVLPTLPGNTSCSSCPHNATHCATLSEYAKEAELYFTSNTTMIFLPGDHTLSMNITAASIIRLTMCGESSSGYVARVVCNGSVGLSFSSMVDFKIHSLSFALCGRSFGNPKFKATLLLESIESAELVNCSFHDNVGTALIVYDTNITLAENSEFTHNHCNHEGFIPNSACIGGGGIAAVDSNLTFTGNTTFIGNDGSVSTGINVTNCSLSSTGSIHFINHTNTGDTQHPTGAIWALASSLSFTGTSNFINNAAGQGGAIYTHNNTLLSFNGTSNFINNSGADQGGAIYASYNVSLSFTGTSTFINNSAYFGGGAIYASYNVSLSFTGTSTFINNSAYFGGSAIYASYNVSLSFNGTSNFINNSADIADGGAIFASYNVSSVFSGTSNFITNSGAISASYNVSLSFNGTSNFSSNTDGDAIAASQNVQLTFTGTSNFINNIDGGAISASYDVSLSFTGTNNFIYNSAAEGGAINPFYNVSLSFTGTSNFINNSAINGGVIYASYNVSFSFIGTNNFISNSAAAGGAISAYNTSLSFNGVSNFISNSAPNGNGGGVYLLSSNFFILPNTTVHWENNYASLGGAIYVDDQSNPFIYCTKIEAVNNKCFFQLPGQNLSNGIDVQFVFKNNFADVAGSALYGGAIDNCTLTGLNPYSSGEVFDRLVHYEDDSTTNSSISSAPFRICTCEGTHLNCNPSRTYAVHPGETFPVSVVTLGQRNGIVPSAVRSRFNHLTVGHLQSFQYTQETNGTCSNLNYTVFALSDNDVQLELYADGPCTTFSDELVLKLDISQTCPPGFNLSGAESSCVCESRLKIYTSHCNITDGLGQITRDSHDQFWVGYDQSHGLILHPHCPLDYCVSHTVEFPLNNTDLQCAYQRTGRLCGACKRSRGYSLLLGTSQCARCTNNHLALLVPFALMGIALVLLLFVCKLTVVTGTLSGVVFYANIVGVNRTLFLPVETTDALSVFIAWLNLDFGIESCFYNGMDAYSKTWLQFVFPVYIWTIVGLLIVVSRFSDKFAKLLGNNPASVLATLILLSYAKILRTIIAAINLTYLEYPTYSIGVWLYDANINYLSGKHTPLFLVAVFFFLFLFLPYTLLLLFGQWLQAVSHLRPFAWVNRLKPFMDSYHAPYKAKHRYWPGLLLVLRFGLLLVFTVNPQQDPSINLLAILVGSAILQLWAWISGGVYRNWCLNALEGSFALNLIILAAATYHMKLSGGNQLAVGHTSVTIALLTFIGILVYHIFQQVRDTKLWKKIPKLNRELNENRVVAKPVSNSEDFSQFREPLLEDPPKPNYGAF